MIYFYNRIIATYLEKKSFSYSDATVFEIT